LQANMVTIIAVNINNFAFIRVGFYSNLVKQTNQSLCCP